MIYDIRPNVCHWERGTAGEENKVPSEFIVRNVTSLMNSVKNINMFYNILWLCRLCMNETYESNFQNDVFFPLL